MLQSGRGPTERGRTGPDGAIGPRPGPDGRGASGPPPTPATHIIAQRRLSLGCGLATVSSKTGRCQLGRPANRLRGTLGGAQRETLLEPFLRAARKLLQNLVETSWSTFGTLPRSPGLWNPWNSTHQVILRNAKHVLCYTVSVI